MHRIDLVEEPERLHRDELFAIRAGLRLLQSKPDAPPSIQDLASVMLIFLNRHNMMLKRYDAGSCGNKPPTKWSAGREEI
jgi:hypothetical protein